MNTVLYGKIDYYITMENKEVISFEISNSTKSYVAAVSVCMWGRGQVCENINPLPFCFLTSLPRHAEKGGDGGEIPIHTRQKPMAKLHNGIFFKVKKNSHDVRSIIRAIFRSVGLFLQGENQYTPLLNVLKLLLIASDKDTR